MSRYTPKSDNLYVKEVHGSGDRIFYFVYDQFGIYDGPYASHGDAASVILRLQEEEDMCDSGDNSLVKNCQGADCRSHGRCCWQ